MSVAVGTKGEGNYAGMVWKMGKSLTGQDAGGWAQDTPDQGVAPTQDIKPGGYDTGSASGSTAGSGAQFQSTFGSKTGGPFGDYQNNLGGSGLRPLDNSSSASMESYTQMAPKANAAPGSGSSGAGGSSKLGASYPGLSAAMSGLNGGGSGGGSSSGGGMDLSGLGGAFGSAVNPGPMVGAPGLGDTAIASAPPQTPDTGFSGSGGSGAQQLSAPTSGRQGIGARIYPSLQALLRTPAY